VLLSRKIAHLLGGVSQLPADLRADYHVAAMENALPHASFGVIRRPPTEHVAVVPVTPNGGVMFHEFIRQSVRYLVVATNGDLKVYNATTGEEVSVSFPSGKTYLNGTLRAVTAGDRVVLANTAVVIEQDTTIPTVPDVQAVIWIRTGDYGVPYTVFIDGHTFSVTVPAAGTATDVQTTLIASDLRTGLAALPGLAAYTLTLSGSMIFVKKNDGSTFDIHGSDGKGDVGMTIIKDTARNSGDLPPNAPDGMVVRVAGDPSSAADDYYVRFDAGTNGSGVWTECAAPSEAVNLKGTTMPWALQMENTFQLLGAHTDLAGIDHAIQFDYGAGFYRVWEVVLTIPTQAYPAGTLVSVTVQGTTYTYTTIGGDTAATIATALNGILPASGTGYTRSGLTFTAVGPTDYVAVGATMALPANSFYNPSLTLTPAAYAGFTLSNTTSGATSPITTNTTDIVTIGAWTGGTRSYLLPGDVCEVTAPGGATMVCSPLTWTPRAAGDLTTVPFPSFVGRTVDEVYFYQGRLGIAAGDSNVLSAAGNILNFFRRTATGLLADDVIDVRQANRAAARYHSASIWRNALYLFTEQGANAMTGDPVLTPTTVRLDPAGQFASAPIRPALAGDSVFIARTANGYTRVAAMVPVPNTDTRVDTSDSTDGVPTYMPGTPTLIIGEGSSGLVFVGTDDDTSALYVYSFLHRNDGSTIGAWGRWTFPEAEILGALLSTGELILLVQRDDVVAIERVSVSSPVGLADHRDRQGLDGEEVAYDSSVTLHPFHRHLRDDSVDTSGRLVIRSLQVFHEAPSECEVTVTQTGRAAAVTASSADDNTVVPVYAKNTEVVITIASTDADPLRITSLEWVGTYTSWSQRG
jgi:hypothetical protein